MPDDVSVAGFDDIRTLRDLVPPLSTVHLELEELGEKAATLALDSRPDDPPRLIMCAARSSCARAPEP